MKLLLLLLALTLTTTASATVLQNNGIPNLVDVQKSDAEPGGGQRGDKITVTAAEMLQSVQWWGAYLFSNNPQSTDSFTVRIYAIVDGTPEQTPSIQYSLTGATRQATTDKISGFTVYSYSSALPNTMLGPGDYVFSLMNDTTADPYSWAWTTGTVTTGTAFVRNLSTDPWSQVELGDLITPVPRHAFNVSGLVVPEPTTFSLLAVAGLGLALQRRRKGFTARGGAARG